MPEYTTFLDASFLYIAIDHDFDDVNDLFATDEGRRMVVEALMRRVSVLKASEYLCRETFDIHESGKFDPSYPNRG